MMRARRVRLAAFSFSRTQASWRLALLSSETEQARRRGTVSASEYTSCAIFVGQDFSGEALVRFAD